MTRIYIFRHCRSCNVEKCETVCQQELCLVREAVVCDMRNFNEDVYVDINSQKCDAIEINRWLYALIPITTCDEPLEHDGSFGFCGESMTLLSVHREPCPAKCECRCGAINLSDMSACSFKRAYTEASGGA